MLTGSQPLLGDEDQSEKAFAQLVDDHRAQRERIVFRAAVRIRRRIDHHRRHPANRRAVAQFAILHAGHQHDERVVPLVGDHVRRRHVDRLRIRKDTLGVVFPHFNQAAQIIPAPDVRPEKPAPQDPGDCRKKPPGIALLIQDFDLEGARLDSDQALQPRQKLLDDERFMGRLNLRNVKVDAGAGARERFVVVERPKHRNRDEAGHGFAGHGDLIEPHMNPRRPGKSRRPPIGRSIDRVGSPLILLRHLIRTIGPASLEDVFRILQGGKHADRLALRRPVGTEVGRRRVFEVRHVHRRRAVQCVERHVGRLPRTGQLEAGVQRRVSVPGDGHFVIEPPPPLALAAEEVVDQPLNDLPERSELPCNGILECVVPFWPRIFFANGGRGLQERSSRTERGSDIGTQLRRKRGNRLFDVDGPAVDPSRPEQLGESPENVLTNHGVVSSSRRRAPDWRRRSHRGSRFECSRFSVLLVPGSRCSEEPQNRAPNEPSTWNLEPGTAALTDRIDARLGALTVLRARAA